MRADDYKRFLNFLRKHQCQLRYQDFRVAPTAAQDSDDVPRVAVG